MRTSKYFNFYGRKRGKKLSKLQDDFISTYLPKISMPGISYEENPKRGKLKIKQIFGDSSPVWLEIGFGGGEHLLSIAKKNRNINILGCELYRNGVAMLLPRLSKENLNNVRVVMDDARVLLEVLPNSSITRLYLLFPDPWPKTRHKQRRFINKDNLKILTRILKTNGLIYIATDVNDYTKHILQIFNDEVNFKWEAESPTDWRNPWRDWENTRYFCKAKSSGRKTTFMIFRKL